MRTLSIFCSIFILIMTGCNKDESPTDTNNNNNNNTTSAASMISATVGGEEFKVSQTSPTYATAYSDPTSGNTVINISDGSKSVSLWFHGNTTGTYQFFETQQNNNVQKTSVSLIISIEQMYLSMVNKGSITVTKYEAPSGKIAGRFSGTFFDTKTKKEIVISDGEFSVTRTM